MQVLKFLGLSVVVLLVFVGLVIFVRKLAYEFYRISFSDARRVYVFSSDLKFNHYWRTRADRLPAQTLRLYCAWAIGRFDRYVPIIDSERQAAKAEYFYMDGWNVGMRSFHFRRINPEAWPVFLVRRCHAALLAALFRPSNEHFKQFDKQAPSHKGPDD